MGNQDPSQGSVVTEMNKNYAIKVDRNTNLAYRARTAVGNSWRGKHATGWLVLPLRPCIHSI